MKIKTYLRLIPFVLILILSIEIVLWLNHSHRTIHIIQHTGILGAGIAIFVMALFHLTPVPSEGLLLIYLRIYGPLLGALWAWIGSLVSTILIFGIARHIGRPTLEKIVAPDNLIRIENWVSEKGTLGLLLARFLPIPAFAINYTAGASHSIKFWDYLWTSAVTMIPYYVGTTLIFEGAFTNFHYLVFIGVFPMIGVWWVGKKLFFSKK